MARNEGPNAAVGGRADDGADRLGSERQRNHSGRHGGGGSAGGCAGGASEVERIASGARSFESERRRDGLAQGNGAVGVEALNSDSASDSRGRMVLALCEAERRGQPGDVDQILDAERHAREPSPGRRGVGRFAVGKRVETHPRANSPIVPLDAYDGVAYYGLHARPPRAYRANDILDRLRGFATSRSEVPGFCLLKNLVHVLYPISKARAIEVESSSSNSAARSFPNSAVAKAAVESTPVERTCPWGVG